MEENDLFDFESDFAAQDVEQPEDSSMYNGQYDSIEEEYDNVEYNNTSDSYIDKLLMAKGLDRNRIQIYDEDGNPQEARFDELSDEDKYDLLKEDYDVPISDEEIDILNYLRQNNISLQEFAEWQRQEGINQYLSSQQYATTDIDNYNDEEIIALDYIKRFGDNMSDEEIDAQIAKLKENPEAFNKQVALLRETYKNEELAQAKLYEQQQQNQRMQTERQFINAYAETLRELDSIQGIELDDNDKSELYQFVLAKDPNNRTAFSKAMDDPESVLKMAWFLLHGEEAMESVIDYYKKEITKRGRSQNTPRMVKRDTPNRSNDAFRFN